MPSTDSEHHLNLNFIGHYPLTTARQDIDIGHQPYSWNEVERYFDPNSDRKWMLLPG